MTDRRRVLIWGGLGLLGWAGLMYLQPKPAAHAGPGPAPKPLPQPAPPPPPPPRPAPPPPPVPAPSRGYQVVGHFPDWNGSLWGIAAHWYGSGAQYPRIYAANAALIESTARAHGFASSEAGHWIFPGERLRIPA